MSWRDPFIQSGLQADMIPGKSSSMHIIWLYYAAGAYEPPKAARSIQLRRTAFAFTRI